MISHLPRVYGPFKHYQGEWQVFSLRSLYLGSLVCSLPVTGYLQPFRTPRVVTNKKANKRLHPSRQERPTLVTSPSYDTPAKQTTPLVHLVSQLRTPHPISCGCTESPIRSLGEPALKVEKHWMHNAVWPGPQFHVAKKPILIIVKVVTDINRSINYHELSASHN